MCFGQILSCKGCRISLDIEGIAQAHESGSLHQLLWVFNPPGGHMLKGSALPALQKIWDININLHTDITWIIYLDEVGPVGQEIDSPSPSFEHEPTCRLATFGRNHPVLPVPCNRSAYCIPNPRWPGPCSASEQPSWARPVIDKEGSHTHFAIILFGNNT